MSEPIQARLQIDLEIARLAQAMQSGGQVLWQRFADRRWYMVTGLHTLFGERVVEYRWGGEGKRPSRVVNEDISGHGNELIAALARMICRRRRSKRYRMVS